MRTLEQIKAMAQSEANREQRPMAILNLNRYSPLYVVRDAQGLNPAKCNIVDIVKPN